MKTVAYVTDEKFDFYALFGTDSFLLPLADFSVSYPKKYRLDEIKKIRKKYPQFSFFVVMNKTIFNSDLLKLTQVLEKLDQLALAGIFFYDLALLQIKQEKQLKTPFVWNQTHMVTNFRTCDYYFDQQVDYALISGELSKKEVKDLVKNTKIKLIYPLVSFPIVAHSRRLLLSHYQKSIGEKPKSSLNIWEKVSKEKYLVVEEKEGTSFFYAKIPNHFSVMTEIDVDYLLLNESYIEHEFFCLLLKLTNQYLRKEIDKDTLLSCVSSSLSKDPFLEQETIYRVKKEDRKQHEKN